ncbi:MAG: serine/threonine protein kinase, partial [Planctomycetes bacterium]|nr:serine/threonine protein kinase [Planctomycetota bacterium]
RGGMGVVYEATQLSLNRKVALKVLPPGATPEQRDIERFQREAQAAARLDHPNIVPIYAQGEEEGTHYYAMRLVRGRSLDQIIHDVRGIDLPACTSTELVRTITADSQATIALEDRPTVPLEEGGPEEAPPERRPTDLSLKYFRTAARLIMEVAEALEYAHSQGVVHRDIKPDNLMLTPEGHLVVTDFGLARFLSAPSITISGEMMGTPAYMSPEQVRAEQQAIDHRTDIYSLGVTLYEMLALEVPFRADTREALLRQILMKDPPPLRRINPRMPRDLETICAKAIEKDPNRRYQSAKLFTHDLHCFLEGLPITARPIGPVGRVYRFALRRRALAAAIAGVLLTLAVGTYFGLQAYSARRQAAEEGGRARKEARAADEARRRAEEQNRRTEAERRAKEAETAKKLEEERWNLLAEAQSLMGRQLFPAALEELTQAASYRHDHVTQLAFWLLARHFSDKPRHTLRGHAAAVFSVAFRPDGKTVASGSDDDTIKLWDVPSGRAIATLTGHSAMVYAVAFTPDGSMLASGGGDRVIKLWNIGRRKEIRSFAAEMGAIHALVFSPDGRTLVGAGVRAIKLWDVATGTEAGSLSGHGDTIWSVAFSPDGQTLASASADHTIKLWDVSAEREVCAFTGHTHQVRAVAFSGDGKTLVSGSSDSTLKVWDVAARSELRTLSGHTGGVCSVAFSLDCMTLVSGSEDGSVKLW